MRKPAQLIRLFYINYVMARYGIDRVVLSAPALSSFRFITYLNPWNWIRPKNRSRGESLRIIFEQLGPIFVKFGQILSTRRDLLPDDIVNELEKLQDNVPPFPGDKAREIVEQAYGCSIHEVFQVFELTPLACASIAQVHAAILHDGKHVVVKILRPGIEKIIQRDLALLYTAAKLTMRFWSHGKRLRPQEIVAEFERSILDELDLMREAANASQLRRNFLHSKTLHVPEIYWTYARPNAIVMERISGIAVSDLKTLNELHVDLKKLAESGVEIFFTQVFRDNFFHADMHPGNIFVSRQTPENPQYIVVDFGIMGSLSPTDLRYLAENLLAFFKRDYRRVAMLHVESGWVPAATRVEEFESAIRCVCEPIFEKPLKDISFGQLLMRLFQTAHRFHMEVQPQLLLLQKTLLNIEGLGRQLYPDLDLWQTAKPYLEQWIKQRYSIRNLIKNIKERAPSWPERMIEMPDAIYDFLQNQKKRAAMISTRIVVEKKTHHSWLKGFFSGAGIVLVVVSLVGYYLKFSQLQNITPGLLIIGAMAFLLAAIL